MSIKKSWKKTLGVIVLAAGSLTLVGCEQPSDFIEGRVIQEYGNVAKMVDSKNPSLEVKDLSTKNLFYGLRVKTDKGLYIIDVDINDNCGSSGGHTAYNLAAAIEVGTKIKFATRYGQMKIFASDRIGKVDPDDIIVLSEKDSCERPY